MAGTVLYDTILYAVAHTREQAVIHVPPFGMKIQTTFVNTKAFSRMQTARLSTVCA